MTVFLYGRRRVARVVGRTTLDGEVEISVQYGGAWGRCVEAFPPSLFGIGLGGGGSLDDGADVSMPVSCGARLSTAHSGQDRAFISPETTNQSASIAFSLASSSSVGPI